MPQTHERRDRNALFRAALDSRAAVWRCSTWRAAASRPARRRRCVALYGDSNSTALPGCAGASAAKRVASPPSSPNTRRTTIQRRIDRHARCRSRAKRGDESKAARRATGTPPASTTRANTLIACNVSIHSPFSFSFSSSRPHGRGIALRRRIAASPHRRGGASARRTDSSRRRIERRGENRLIGVGRNVPARVLRPIDHVARFDRRAGQRADAAPARDAFRPDLPAVVRGSRIAPRDLDRAPRPPFPMADRRRARGVEPRRLPRSSFTTQGTRANLR